MLPGCISNTSGLMHRLRQACRWPEGRCKQQEQEEGLLRSHILMSWMAIIGNRINQSLAEPMLAAH